MNHSGNLNLSEKLLFEIFFSENHFPENQIFGIFFRKNVRSGKRFFGKSSGIRFFSFFVAYLWIIHLFCRSRLASSMIRHLPKAPAQRFWVTGNYIFDYRSNEYGLGASLQTLLIGNGKTHLPQIAFFKLRQEAMGKYTNELTVKIHLFFHQQNEQSSAVFQEEFEYDFSSSWVHFSCISKRVD